ncbi:hypothetical protein I302_106419 [Kwoniella bestiolae CBS 10118]|uniref:Uncharacterized protein n=1 Tax=Kwoniella bestiolae CBS 10118 TaxID=1296100 RepID=A0A1B9G1G4_9TREE|nr:hypothetical protein I302_06323 [Kwoniella bestiolae CBS 10118]OCF24862.1 hypothetical protein I302_06323 [Kwoniella bestiolae CBS 10118]
MSENKQIRRDLTNDEIPLFELLRSTISALDDVNVFAFAGTIPLRDEDKGLLKLFTKEDGQLKLRSFPLSDADAKGIHNAGEDYVVDGEPGGGRVLGADKFGLTGLPHVPSWVLNRISGQYSSPIEYRLKGLFVLGVGESMVLPNDKSTEYAEECSYINPSNNIKYYMSTDISERAGTLLISLPTKYSGGELVMSKPENTEEGIMLSSTVDWSSANLEDDTQWNVKYCYFNPPARATISPIKEGTMLFLQYHIWVNDESEYLKSVEVDHEVGKDAIKERIKKILDGEDILKEGGMVGFGLNGYYDNWSEEKDEVAADDGGAEEKGGVGEPSEGEDASSEAEGDEPYTDAWFKKHQPKPPRTITSEEEARLIEELPKKLKGSDKILLQTISEMGLTWHFEAVYMAPEDDENEEKEQEQEDAKDGADGKVDVDNEEEGQDNTDIDGNNDGSDGDKIEQGQEEAAEEEFKLDDPTKQSDMWTSRSFYATQGEVITNTRSVRKALLEKGVKKDEAIYWINTPMYYNNEVWYKHEANRDEGESSWETAVYNTVSVGIAIIVELPSKKYRMMDGL